MEYLKRKVKSDVEECNNDMHVDIIDGIRLSLRFVDKEKPEENVIINFTHGETKKIKEVLKKWILQNIPTRK